MNFAYAFALEMNNLTSKPVLTSWRKSSKHNFPYVLIKIIMTAYQKQSKFSTFERLFLVKYRIGKIMNKEKKKIKVGNFQNSM